MSINDAILENTIRLSKERANYQQLVAIVGERLQKLAKEGRVFIHEVKEDIGDFPSTKISVAFSQESKGPDLTIAVSLSRHHHTFWGSAVEIKPALKDRRHSKEAESAFGLLYNFGVKKVEKEDWKMARAIKDGLNYFDNSWSLRAFFHESGTGKRDDDSRCMFTDKANEWLEALDQHFIPQRKVQPA